MTETENIALSYLPYRLAEAVRKTLSLWNTPVSEIRLREKRQLSVTIGGKNVTCEMLCTREDLQQTVAAVCGNSLYSHSDSIREGCITTDCGIRVGVCGHAVTSDGHISMVRDITSLNLRIPHRIPGAADELFRRMQNFPNVLIYSSPGKGKTTGSVSFTDSMKYILSGTPKYTSPAPERSAPMAARAAAPVYPLLPQSKSNLP